MYRLVIIGIVLFLGTNVLYGADITSTNFIIRDPVIGTGGGYGSSASFSLIGAGNTLLSGLGSSTSYISHYGFLYYPFVTDVTLTATPNGADADLSWPAAVATTGLGWTVSGYNTGIATVSGGPYTYTAVGNVTSYSYTDLEPGTYCFVLQTLDGLGAVIATSNEDCIVIEPIIIFAISDNSIGFGSLSTTTTRYATEDAVGSDSEPTSAHTITARTNAPDGYVITVVGDTLTLGGYTVSPISGGPSALSIGSEQFGIRATASGGIGAVTSPYNGSSGNYGYSTTPTTPTGFSSASGPTTTTTYDVNYATNIAPTTEAGAYSTTLTYIITGTF